VSFGARTDEEKERSPSRCPPLKERAGNNKRKRSLARGISKEDREGEGRERLLQRREKKSVLLGV